MAWVRRLHTKSEIDRAGQALVPWWVDYPDVELPADVLGQGFTIIQNWRTSHSFPLNTFQVNLRKRARKVDSDALVAQRLKRFSSVMNKLARQPKMKLSQMQDLGGCRAIVRDVNAVDELFNSYRGTGDDLFEAASSLKCYDYIRNPKPDGYRGVHVVGRYNARFASQQSWTGQRIEIQLRSRLQHAFATAVETVTTFTRAPLKFGAGPEEWRRFFSLTGSVFAVREDTALVPGTPQNEGELLRELREATKMLKVRQRLRGWSNALKRLPRKRVKKFRWLLLVLDVDANTINVTGFEKAREAAATLAQIEKRPELDAVLVWVEWARDLRAAYPNYYADTSEFIDALDMALRGVRVTG